LTLQLTTQNYHSNEANQQYMSVSQYKDFMNCEARAMARLHGWREPESDALLIGSYVHAHFEGTLEQFKDEHPELISSRGPTKGELKSDYLKANIMIEAIEKDEFCMFVLQGQKEILIQADMFGVTWKAKLDVYAPDQDRIADLKTVKSIREKVWDPNYGYVSFVEGYGYIIQMAVYTELERRYTNRDRWLEPLIVAVSKEDVPDKEIISFDEHRLKYELEIVERNMPRILDVKQGIQPPKRCDKCRYCRETKKVTKITHFMDLIV